MSALEAVLKGKLFVSASMAGNDPTDPKDEHAYHNTSARIVLPFPPQNLRIARRHEVGFYSHDRHLLDDLTQFVGTALKAGNAAIVVATESHRDSLIARLQAYGVNLAAAIEQGPRPSQSLCARPCSSGLGGSGWPTQQMSATRDR